MQKICSMHLCLVEDDTALAAALSEGLQAADYSVAQVARGNLALDLLGNGSFDLAIVDIGLPDRSGIDVIRQLRRLGSKLPVLILTARDGSEDRVIGLDAGADDYLTKPFDFNELLARLRAIYRRAGGNMAALLQCGDVCLDLTSRELTVADQAVELGRREFMLLKLLLENAGRIVTRDRLETELYGWLDPVASNALEVHVHHLRKKIGADRIRTMRGVGYMLVNVDAGND